MIGFEIDVANLRRNARDILKVWSRVSRFGTWKRKVAACGEEEREQGRTQGEEGLESSSSVH